MVKVSEDDSNHDILEASTNLAGRGLQNKKVTIAILILISSLVAATMTYHLLLADTFVAQLASSYGLALLVVLAVIPYASGIYLFRKVLAPASKEMRASNSSPFLRLTYNLLKFAFAFNAIVLTILISQVLIVKQFYLALTIIGAQANVILLAVTCSYLSFKFLSWFRSNHDLAVLFFGITFAMIASGSVLVDATQISFFLRGDPTRIEEQQEVVEPQENINYFQSGNTKSDPQLRGYFLTIQIPLRIAFVFYWLGTVLLLNKYSQTIGKTKFWVLVSMPLVAYAVSSILIYGAFTTQLVRGIVASISAIAGGVMFGMIFLVVARGLRNSQEQSREREGSESKVQRNMIPAYLSLSAYGTILFLIANIPPNHIVDWAHLPYPPFGDIVWSFTGFAIYLYSFGVYFSTISISHNAKLRKALHKLATETGDMMHNLGYAQMQQEIRDRVARISKEQEELLKEQTGVENHASEAEMKQYAKDVLEEIQKMPKKSGTN